ADHRCRALHVLPLRELERPGEDVQGTGCLCQGESRQARLRDRQHHPETLVHAPAATRTTPGILAFAQMNSPAAIEMLHVPYKGEPQGITDLVGGRVQVMWATPATRLNFVKEGKIRALVTQLNKRSSLLPDVPTIHEAGLPKFTITSWAALFGPAKLPKEIVARLNKEFTAAM